MTAISMGFLQPDPVHVRVSEPDIRISNEHISPGQAATHWDYNTPVEVEWRMVVDLERIQADCKLGPLSRIQMNITWHSTWTNLRGCSPGVLVVQGENTAHLELPGSVLGGTLALEARLVLATPDSVPAPVAPRRPGSTLWRHRVTVPLEGAGSRFPTIAVDFASEGRAGGLPGAWYLWMSDDLAASTTGAVRIELNSSHPDIQQMLNHPGTDMSKATSRFIRYDVARQLVAAALNHEELDDATRYDEGTLGHLMLRLLQNLLPARSIHDLRMAWRDDPSDLEAELQARLLGAPSA